jgi:hypothetical protein
LRDVAVIERRIALSCACRLDLDRGVGTNSCVATGDTHMPRHQAAIFPWR